MGLKDLIAELDAIQTTTGLTTEDLFPVHVRKAAAELEDLVSERLAGRPALERRRVLARGTAAVTIARAIVADWVRAGRAAVRFSRSDLARVIDRSAGYVRKLEMGEARVDAHVLLSIDTLHEKEVDETIRENVKTCVAEARVRRKWLTALDKRAAREREPSVVRVDVDVVERRLLVAS